MSRSVTIASPNVKNLRAVHQCKFAIFIMNFLDCGLLRTGYLLFGNRNSSWRIHLFRLFLIATAHQSDKGTEP